MSLQRQSAVLRLPRLTHRMIGGISGPAAGRGRRCMGEQISCNYCHDISIWSHSGDNENCEILQWMK